MASHHFRAAVLSICLLSFVFKMKSQRLPSKQQKALNTSLAQDLKQLQANVKALEKRVKQLADERIMLLRGRDGRDGRDGHSGPKGARGLHGARGPRGPKGDRSGGLQYTRWGRTTCPPSAKLVYKGAIAGEHHSNAGGGVNNVCLVENPIYAKYTDGHQSAGSLYTTEYQLGTGFNPFRKNVHNHDAPCAVCYVSARSTKLMIPGTNACPAGWTREYYGYLMTAFRGHPHPMDIICVDNDPEGIRGSHGNKDGALLYAVEGVCGHGVPCGPYVAGRELTCAVCSI